MLGIIESVLRENITKDYQNILGIMSSTDEKSLYLLNELKQSTLPISYNVESDKYEQVDPEEVRIDIVYNMLRKIWSEEELIINSKNKKKSNTHKKFKRKHK